MVIPSPLNIDVPSTSTDEAMMRRALGRARRALGRTAPNPPVGAIVVRDGAVVGSGWTSPPGGPHAEIVALRQAGATAAGSTLYVTLEPCCHYGRTPPCTDAIIAAGVARCVVATGDPFPAVRGSGIAALRRAGIEVTVGPGEQPSRDLLAGYLTRVRTGRPLVHAKYAMTLDGRIATRTGDSQWITGEHARLVAHRIRDRADAILVGIGTVLADDPSLTTRLPLRMAGAGGPHHPLRVILDGRGRLQPGARVIDPSMPGATLVATTATASARWRSDLGRAGVDVVVLGDGPRVLPADLLDELGRRGVTNLLVEGGGAVLGSFHDAGLIDRVTAFLAPVLVGGETAPGPVGGRGADDLARAVRLPRARFSRVGDDILVEATVRPVPSGEEW